MSVILNYNQKVFEDVLLDLERLKSHLLNEYQKEQVLKYTNTLTNPDYKQPLIFKGSPVFQFSYAGSLPLFVENDDKLKEFTKSYMEWCTYNIYDPSKNDIPFKKAKVFIQHFYNNKIISDLDNRNHKFILDAIRMAQIIEDDNWQNVSLDISGHIDKTDHVQVYVIEDSNKHDFGKYLDDNKYALKKTPFPHEMFMEKKEQSVQKEVEEVDVKKFW